MSAESQRAGDSSGMALSRLFASISGVILARNEESNIVDCLKALRPHVSEILLIDMESEDRTVELARPMVDRVLTHPIAVQFDAARNIAIPEASNDWLWFVDADERIPEATGRLVNDLLRDRGHELEAISIPFKSYFGGKWMQHCGWWPGYTGPRLLKRGFFEWSSQIHGGVHIRGRHYLVPPDPRYAVDHFGARSVEHYVEKINRYSTADAEFLERQGATWNWRSAVREMVRELWTCYDLNPGHLDGERGWIVAWISGQYRWLAQTKLLDRGAVGNPSDAGAIAPRSLDEFLDCVRESLSEFRACRPRLPLGIVWKAGIWNPSGYADEARCFLKALASGPRPLKFEDVQHCVMPEPGVTHEDEALFRLLARTERPPYAAAVTHLPGTALGPDCGAALNILRVMIETDRFPEAWARHAEQFDEIWVPSRWVASACCRSWIPPEKVRLVPEYLDTDVFCPQGDRMQLPEPLRNRFVFLSVFDWVPRKGCELLLRALCEEFRPDEGVGLLMKITRIHGTRAAGPEVERILATFGQSLRERSDIVLLDATLTTRQMGNLYRSVDAFVLASRGEGWGRPYMEAMACGLPTIGTRATGNMEFMDDTNSFLVSAESVDVPEAAVERFPLFRGLRWHEPDVGELRRRLRYVVQHTQEARQTACKASCEIREKFSLRAAAAAVEQALASAERRFIVPRVEPAAESQLRVVLDGEVFAVHSFSNINEEIALRFAQDDRLALSIRRLRQHETFDQQRPNAPRLRPYIGREFQQGPHVTIRHAYPPNWERPPKGLWVHIQPWEYGCIPRTWLEPLRDSVQEIWVPSSVVKDGFVRSGIPADKIEVIPWGVDPGVFHPRTVPVHLPTEKSFRFLFVGGSIRRKGIDRLLEAFGREFRRDEDVCLIIKDLGTKSFYRVGNYRDRILAAQADSASPEIHYYDRLLTEGQLAGLYAACHCLVAPYRGEGFGLPILEAMACGLASIVPRQGASDDITTPQTTFYLPSRIVEFVAQGEPLCGPATELDVEIDDLRQAMRHAYENRAATNSLGVCASEHVLRRFTWEHTTRRMVERLQALVRGADADGRCSSNLSERGRHAAISLCMIVRDNAATLDAALSSIKPWVDEMIVVDTGSTDNTPEIAAKNGARVFHFPWCDDFSAARNESIRHARGDWIFWMDSDDTIDESCGRKLRALADQPVQASPMAYVMQVHCPGGGGSELTVVDHVKMFRNLPELRFDGRIHEQILPAIRRARGDIRWNDVFVIHSGADVSAEGRRRKHERDLRLLQLELRERPDHPFTLFNLGMTYADMREHERAADFLSRSIMVSPSGDSHVRKAYALLVSSLTELGRTAAAWETCEKGLALFPRDVELLFRRGILAHRCGRLEDAERAYLAALSNDDETHFSSLDPGIYGFKARHNLAVVYCDMGKLAEAETQWRQAVQEAPEFAPGWRGLGEVLVRQGKHGVAVAEVYRLLAHRRLRVEALLVHAQVSAAEGRLEEARQLLERAVCEFPAELEPLRRLCQLLFERGGAADAEKAIRSLVERDPQDASARHNLGTVLLQLNRLDEAAQCYRASLQLRPCSAATWFNLAHALQGLGRVEEANATFAEANRLAAAMGQPVGAS